MTTHGPIYEIVKKGGPQFTFLLSEIEKLEPVWIPVTEKLPDGEDVVRCLVYASDRKVREGFYYPLAKGFNYLGVTHWMNLPSPPSPLPPNE